MPAFTLSGFADEISIDFGQQIEGLKSLGIAHMEIRMVDGESIVNHTLDEVRSLKDRLDQAGVRISAVGSPLGKVPITDDFQDYIPLFRHTLDIADCLDTHYIRLFSFYIPQTGTREQYRDEVIRRMRVFVSEAESRGITLLHENEAGIYGENADCCADLFRSIPSKYFRAVFDPGNFVAAGVEVFPYAYDLLKDYIQYVHIKDAVRITGSHEIRPAGEGAGRVADVLKALWASGFSGFLSIEPHLHNVYAKKEIFSAYKDAMAHGKTGAAYVGDGLEQFRRAYNALKILIDGISA